jgi:ankyrin repeat protein
MLIGSAFFADFAGIASSLQASSGQAPVAALPDGQQARTRIRIQAGDTLFNLLNQDKLSSDDEQKALDLIKNAYVNNVYVHYPSNPHPSNPQQEETTVLHLAIRKGLLDIMKALLQCNAQVDVPTLNNDIALHFAIKQLHQAIDQLWRAQAINQLRQAQAINQLQLCQAQAIHQRDSAKIKEKINVIISMIDMLLAGMFPQNKKLLKIKSPLDSMAEIMAETARIKLLNSVNGEDKSPLDLMAEIIVETACTKSEGNEAILQRLLEVIRRLTNQGATLKRYRSFSQLVKQSKHPIINKVMLPWIEERQRTETLFMILAEKNGKLTPANEQIALDLINEGVDLSAKHGQLQETLLLIAVHNGQLSIVKALLEKGADVNARDINGNTLLYRSIIHLWNIVKKQQEITPEIKEKIKAMINVINALIEVKDISINKCGHIIVQNRQKLFNTPLAMIAQIMVVRITAPDNIEAPNNIEILVNILLITWKLIGKGAIARNFLSDQTAKGNPVVHVQSPDLVVVGNVVNLIKQLTNLKNDGNLGNLEKVQEMVNGLESSIIKTTMQQLIEMQSQADNESKNRLQFNSNLLEQTNLMRRWTNVLDLAKTDNESENRLQFNTMQQLIEMQSTLKQSQADNESENRLQFNSNLLEQTNLMR